MIEQLLSGSHMVPTSAKPANKKKQTRGSSEYASLL